MKLLLIISLLGPLQSQADMFMWNENGVTQMSGHAPECYINPIPTCPGIDVYHNGRLISSNRTESDKAIRRQIAGLPAIAVRVKADVVAREHRDREIATAEQQRNAGLCLASSNK
jgi:hypothetical protein